jgi:hypothetical protein
MSSDKHALALAYSHAASRQHIMVRIACMLETKGILRIERGTQQEGFDLYLNHNRLQTPFLDDDLHEVERQNTQTLRRLLPRLRSIVFREPQDHNTVQITSGYDNYVELTIELDSGIYTLRWFLNINDVGIKDAAGRIDVLPISRTQANPRIFSDWLVE